MTAREWHDSSVSYCDVCGCDEGNKKKQRLPQKQWGAERISYGVSEEQQQALGKKKKMLECRARAEEAQNDLKEGLGILYSDGREDIGIAERGSRKLLKAVGFPEPSGREIKMNMPRLTRLSTGLVSKIQLRPFFKEYAITLERLGGDKLKIRREKVAPEDENGGVVEGVEGQERLVLEKDSGEQRAVLREQNETDSNLAMSRKARNRIRSLGKATRDMSEMK